MFEILRLSDNSEPLGPNEFLELVHEEDKLELSKVFKKTYKNKETFNLEIRFVLGEDLVLLRLQRRA